MSDRQIELTVALIRALAPFHDMAPGDIGEAMGRAVAALRNEEVLKAAQGKRP